MKKEITVVDLSHKIDLDTPIYPGDNPVKLRSVTHFDSVGYRDSQITIQMHIGTHMDGPFHMLSEAKSLDQYPPCRFIGDGVVLDAEGKEKIDVDLLQNPLVRKADFLVIRTGFYKKYFSEDYFSSYPPITIAFAERLVNLGITLIAIDTPSPDYYPHNIHRLLFENDVLIIENLANVDKLPTDQTIRMYCLPLKIEADSAPVRVIAKYTKELLCYRT